jgi:hypothetical protein
MNRLCAFFADNSLNNEGGMHLCSTHACPQEKGK